MKSSKASPDPYPSSTLHKGILGALLSHSLLGCSNDGRRSWDILAEDVSLDKPREPHSRFVVDEFLGWD
jgi:hypothetical protein